MWKGPYKWGETCEITHAWNEKESFKIKVKAKDEHGKESDWSDTVTISITKNKTVIIYPLFQTLLEFLEDRFPLFITSLF